MLKPDLAVDTPLHSQGPETHHGDTPGLVHGAHGHERSQANDDAIEGHTPEEGQEGRVSDGSGFANVPPLFLGRGLHIQASFLTYALDCPPTAPGKDPFFLPQWVWGLSLNRRELTLPKLRPIPTIQEMSRRRGGWPRSPRSCPK